MKYRLSFFLLSLATAMLFTSCAGYQLGPVKPSKMAGIETLFVPVFANDTLEMRIETLVTNTVLQQIQLDGTYDLAPAYDEADAVMEATIVDVERRPRRSVRGNVIATAEFEVSIEIAYRIIDPRTGVQLLAGTARGQTNFFVGDDIQQEEAQAIPVAARDAAKQLVSEISEGW